MWCSPVKFGGDSGAAQQVSDIGGGFGSASFTARSPGCHAIAVKQEIIAATPRRGLVTEAMPVVASACGVPRAFSADLRAACTFSSIRADLCTQRSPGRRESETPRFSIRRLGDP